MSDIDKDTQDTNNTNNSIPTITNISTTDLTTNSDTISNSNNSISNSNTSNSNIEKLQSNTTEINESQTQTQTQIQPIINPIAPPEIPTTTSPTTTTSYTPVTGQSQTVTTQRHNPINTTVATIPASETKTDEQTLLNQYANTAQYYLPSAIPTATLGNNALGGALGSSGLVGALGGNALGGVGGLAGLTGVSGVGGNALGGVGVGGVGGAQQYLLYNQLNNYNGALLRAQLMAQRVAQLQTLNNNTNSQQWVLFVFHLPEDMDDNGLLLLFSAFGATQAIVMRHKNTDCSRGFGFVHFRTKQEAQIAIDMMNGYQIGHKRLRVSFKKSKE
eukprot:1009603_1